MASVFQWNIRGLRASYNELLILMKSFQPVAFCLQELKIPNFYSFVIDSILLSPSYQMWIIATHLVVDLAFSSHTVN
jgi:hypothetical protein